ncbi:hypothetical protein [Prevotella melaninogenica]
MTQILIELLKMCIPSILAFILSYMVLKKTERVKLNVLKEKEWHVKWADTFFLLTIKFNENITIVICTLYYLQSAQNNEKEEEELYNRIYKHCRNLSEIEWQIQHYLQFSNTYKDKIVKAQTNIMDKISRLNKGKKGNLEEIRELQFEYNKLVRKAHAELLKMENPE